MPISLTDNYAISTLAGPITNTSTVINLASGSGSIFPNPSNGQYFVLTLNDQASGTLYEICYVYARSGDVLSSIVRAQEGTTGLNWVAGDIAVVNWTAGQILLGAQVLSFSGSNPNGFVAGTTATVQYGPTFCWSGGVLWACSQTGPAATAVWKVVGNFQPLTGDLHLYVSTSGDDANSGLTPSTPFATIQRAVDVVQNYALNGFSAVINVFPGVYTAGATISNTPNGSIVITSYGAGTVTVAVTSANCFDIFGNSTSLFLTGGSGSISLAATGSPSTPSLNGNGIAVSRGASCSADGVIFQACTNYHVNVAGGSYVFGNPITIAASAAGHIRSSGSGTSVSGRHGTTVTLIGSPHFSDDFVGALYASSVFVFTADVTFSGPATGARYSVDYNAMIITGAAGPNFFPGNAAGVIGSHGAPIYD